MKTFKSFAYLMAIAIVSVGLASCNTNDPEEQQGTPSYNGQTAKTQYKYEQLRILIKDDSRQQFYKL